VAEYSLAITALPDGTVARSNRAQAYLALGRPAEALADCEFIIGLGGTVPAKVWLRAGQAQRALRRGQVRVRLAAALIAQDARVSFQRGLKAGTTAERSVFELELEETARSEVSTPMAAAHR
jgi:hypothetical protein